MFMVFVLKQGKAVPVITAVINNGGCLVLGISMCFERKTINYHLLVMKIIIDLEN